VPHVQVAVGGVPVSRLRVVVTVVVLVSAVNVLWLLTLWGLDA
jgi:hypothetical protein